MSISIIINLHNSISIYKLNFQSNHYTRPSFQLWVHNPILFIYLAFNHTWHSSKWSIQFFTNGSCKNFTYQMYFPRNHKHATVTDTWALWIIIIGSLLLMDHHFVIAIATIVVLLHYGVYYRIFCTVRRNKGIEKTMRRKRRVRKRCEFSLKIH